MARYEVVIYNYEGQNHPYHLHGFYVNIIGYNYTEVPLEQSPYYNKNTGLLEYAPERYGIASLGEPVRSFPVPHSPIAALFHRTLHTTV